MACEALPHSAPGDAGDTVAGPLQHAADEWVTRYLQHAEATWGINLEHAALLETLARDEIPVFRLELLTEADRVQFARWQEELTVFRLQREAEIADLHARHAGSDPVDRARRVGPEQASILKAYKDRTSAVHGHLREIERRGNLPADARCAERAARFPEGSQSLSEWMAAAGAPESLRVLASGHLQADATVARVGAALPRDIKLMLSPLRRTDDGDPAGTVDAAAGRQIAEELAAAQAHLETLRRHADQLEQQLAEATKEIAALAVHGSPTLRMGTRALKTATARRGVLRNAMRDLVRQKKITPEERAQFERAEPIALRGEEILVVAGLLYLSRQSGALRRYGPARIRAGGIVSEQRISVQQPPIEEFCRLLGFPVQGDGRVSGSHRESVEGALDRLTEKRPIVVETHQVVGHSKDGKPIIAKHWELTGDAPLKRSVRDDGTRSLDLHPALAAGYWHGHLQFDRLPEQWDRAKEQIGARYLDDPMKWADLYFCRLAIAVKYEHARHGTPPARLAAGLPKRLKVDTLLEELELEAYRKKKGPKDTAARLAKVLNFCVARGSLVSWVGDGVSHYDVVLPNPSIQEGDPEDETEALAEGGADGRALIAS